MNEFLLFLFLRAQAFCVELPLHQNQCIVVLVECYLDDNRDWCEDNIYQLYKGI